MIDPSEQERLREVELGDLALRNAEALAFPLSEIEAVTLAEVLQLTPVVVTRPPYDRLLAAGMVPYECHRNCAMQVANDPDGGSQHISGWLPYGDSLILHSVVQMHGEWICLTPQLVSAPRQFPFIPDPYLEWRAGSDGLSWDPYRNGELLPSALRRDPARNIRMWNEFKLLVDDGMSAFDAREVVQQANARPVSG